MNDTKVWTEQGTVDVSFSGASPELVNKYLPPIEQEYDTSAAEASKLPCPSLNIVIHVVGSRGRPYLPLPMAAFPINLSNQAMSSHSLPLELP